MAAPMQGYTQEAPYDAGHVEVGPLHRVYYEQWGKKDGNPVIYVQGGPGGAVSPWCATFFDPAVYRIILYDQRGCGKSEPVGEIRDNTSQDLVEDIEKLRKHLGIAKWHQVFGGSWGSTLTLLYAQAHPEAVGSLILRGVWLFCKEEIEFTLGPVSQMFPEVYERVFRDFTAEQRATPFAEFSKRMNCGDQKVEFESSRLYTFWIASIASILPPFESPEDIPGSEEKMLASNRINVNYMLHTAWLRDGQLLEPENIRKIESIPTAIVQGRYDLLCPLISAHKLHKVLKRSEMFPIADAGHSAGEPGIRKKLIELCDDFGKRDFSTD